MLNVQDREPQNMAALTLCWDSLLFTMPQWLYLFRLKSALWTGQNLVSYIPTSLYKKVLFTKTELRKRSYHFTHDVHCSKTVADPGFSKRGGAKDYGCSTHTKAWSVKSLTAGVSGPRWSSWGFWCSFVLPQPYFEASWYKSGFKIHISDQNLEGVHACCVPSVSATAKE